MRRGYNTGDEFDVRYYLPADLLAMFASRIGALSLEIDCFIGLNIRSEDLSFVRRRYQPVILANRALMGFANNVIALKWLADSLYVLSIKLS